MTDVKFVALLIACLKLKFALCEIESNVSCYADDKSPYLLTGSTTPYEFVHGLIGNSSVPNCEPLQIWMLCRHGTRYPSTSEIKNMLNNLPDLQRKIIENYEKNESGSLCQRDIENLKAWKLDPKLSLKRSKFLTEQGRKDLESLGRRLKNDFPELLELKSSEEVAEKYHFRATDTERTVASMKSFITGLLGNDTDVDTEIVPTADDTLLKPYKTCDSWLKEMRSSSTREEINTFINGTEFQQFIADVSRRLGFPNNLTLDSVWLMYTACAFGKAWNPNEISPWCAVFNENELRIFEYEDDLFTYYSTGYGKKMSSQIGCPPMKDMFNHFSKLEEGVSDEKLGIFYFTHRASLQTFYTAMGINEDSIPLTAENFQKMENRKWRTSLIAPFAVNFLAVFYKCDSSHKVRFYLAEKPLEYEGCETGICDWEYLKKKLGPSAADCTVDFCKN